MRDQPCSGQVQVLEMNGRKRTKAARHRLWVLARLLLVRVKGLENLFLQIVTMLYVILARAIAIGT